LWGPEVRGAVCYTRGATYGRESKQVHVPSENARPSHALGCEGDSIDSRRRYVVLL